MTTEKWLPVPGYVGLYEVSDHGRVRSLDRVITDKIGRRKPVAGRLMRGGTNGRYKTFLLCRGGEVKNHTLHSLVLKAFVGPRPEGADGCHNDGDVTNNHVSNLRWDTREGNMADVEKHGGWWNAKKTHCKWGHEFTEENTRLIRKAGRKPTRSCLTCARLSKGNYRTAGTTCPHCGRECNGRLGLGVHLSRGHGVKRPAPVLASERIPTNTRAESSAGAALVSG